MFFGSNKELKKDTVSTGIYLKRNIREKLDKIAKKHSRSRSNVIEVAIKYYIKQLEEQYGEDIYKD